MKKITALFFLLLIGSSIFSACQRQNEVNNDENPDISLTTGYEIDSRQLFSYGELLDKSDSEVSAGLGMGKALYKERGGAAQIESRVYQNNILGFACEIKVQYNEAPTAKVKSIIIAFKGAAYNDVLDAMSQQLGEAVLLRKSEEGENQAIWHYEKISFQLTDYNNSILLTIRAIAAAAE